MQNAVKEWRRKRNMSQQKLADAVGVTRISIYNIEKNNSGECTVSTAFAIAKALNCNINRLFF